MRFIISVAMLIAPLFAFGANTKLKIAVGDSVPAGSIHASPTGPSRANGGETIHFSFREFKHISSIRLTGYSKSKLGKVVIRNAMGSSLSGSKTVEVPFETLFRFASADKAGSPADLSGAVQLAEGNFVEARPNDLFYELKFQVEGFKNNDATVLIEIESADALSEGDFLMTRTGSSETVGSFIDEKAYATFQAPQLKALVANGENPSLEELAGKTFVCSHYAKTGAPSIDFKTRQYSSPSPGVLQSSTDKDSRLVTWILTEQGWKLGSQTKNSCGTYTTEFILRITSEGNLVTESTINREEYLNLCVSAGYGRAATDNQLRGDSFQSVIDSKYVVLSYEFCRPARL